MKRISKMKTLVLGALLASGLTMALTNDVAAATRAEVKRIIIDEAENSRVPVSLALAVAKIESNFNDKAESSAGARGVMQIMPKTARTEFDVKANELWDARLNVQLGIAYLEQLFDQYGGKWNLALSHYNGGTLKGKGAKARPHSYTRKYVANVQRWQDRFSDRYGDTQLASADTDSGWQSIDFQDREQELDTVRRIIVREIEDRESDLDFSPTRIKRWNEGRRGGRAARNNRFDNRPWRVAKTDFGDADFKTRLRNARNSLDDFSSEVRWIDG